MLRRIIFITILLMLSTFLMAEELITLESMITKALAKSLSIEAELLQYKSQVSAKRQSMYYWLPSASLNLGKSWQDDEWQDMNGSFNANWSLASNDSRYFDMRRQMIEMMNSDLSLEDVRKNITYNVLTRYIDVLEADEIVELQREVLAVEEKKYQRIAAQQSLGEINLLDLEQSEIDRIQAEISLNDLLLSLDNKRAELFYYTGCEDEGSKLAALDIEISGEIKTYQPNLQYQIQEKSLKSRKLMLDQALLDLLPTLSLNWNYSRNSVDDVSDFDEYSESSQVAFLLSYSIFDVFSNYENLSMAKRQYKFYQRQLLDQQQADIKELNNLNKTLASQNRNLQLYSRKAELAARILEKAQVEYEQGTISILDLNEYQNKLYSARKNKILENYRLLQTQEQVNLLLSDDILGKW